MKKLTIEFVKESFEKEGYTLLDTIYKNSRTKLNYICPMGHEHSIVGSSWYRGHRCPYCAGLKKLTIEFVKESFEKEGYTLLNTVYINSKTKLNYICAHEHKHSISWNEWTHGNRCPYCAGVVKYTIEFVKTSFEKEDYTLLSKEYIGAFSKLDYICPQGHQHNIRWHDWQHGHRCQSCAINNSAGQGNPSWKGGVVERNVPLYDTYNGRLSFCEETRRDPNDLDILQIKCTKCEMWFTPTSRSVQSRITALNSITKGESRFYCSDECKHSCSIFGRRLYYANEKHSKTNLNFTSSELQTWSKEVLKRTDHVCEYCGGLAIEAHHIQPKKLEPFFALDPDNGIACCESCHYKYGHSNECSTGALANIIC